MSAYDKFVELTVSGYVTSKTIKAMLMTDDYVQDVSAHEYLSDITALDQEVTDSGYSRDTLSNVSVTIDNDAAIVGADDLDFGTFSADTSVGAVIFYVDTGTESTSVLVAADTDGFDVPAGADLAYEVDGIVAFSVDTD